MDPLDEERTHWNRSRTRPGDAHGFYESYFQRANHPTQPQAFWIRYTSFSPAGHPEKAVGELWAVYFEAGRITAVKETFPLSACSFSRERLHVQIGRSTLYDGWLEGQAASSRHRITWQLAYSGDQPPLLLLPRSLYAGGFPKAKALVGTPGAVFSGALTVDGQGIAIDNWVGSQNHNWGTRHTDQYAWGQVAGFDNAPRAFFECSTARVRLGPLWSPWLTLMVLRIGGEDIALNSLVQSVRAHGRFRFFSWDLDSRARDVRLHGRIQAPASAFVGLRYDNPPGGSKTCLNTKLARCELTLQYTGKKPLTLLTENRAAFEILTDATDHGVPVIG